MRAQRRVTFDDVLDQIREQQIDVAKLADDDPLKPVLRRLFALYGEMCRATIKVRTERQSG